LERFNQVQTLDKEKNIKFFQCIGDPQLGQEGVDFIKKEKEDNYVNTLKFNKSFFIFDRRSF